MRHDRIRGPGEVVGLVQGDDVTDSQVEVVRKVLPLRNRDGLDGHVEGRILRKVGIDSGKGLPVLLDGLSDLHCARLPLDGVGQVDHPTGLRVAGDDHRGAVAVVQEAVRRALAGGPGGLAGPGGTGGRIRNLNLGEGHPGACHEVTLLETVSLVVVVLVDRDGASVLSQSDVVDVLGRPVLPLGPDDELRIVGDLLVSAVGRDDVLGHPHGAVREGGSVVDLDDVLGDRLCSDGDGCGPVPVVGDVDVAARVAEDRGAPGEFTVACRALLGQSDHRAHREVGRLTRGIIGHLDGVARGGDGSAGALFAVNRPRGGDGVIGRKLSPLRKVLRQLLTDLQLGFRSVGLVGQRDLGGITSTDRDRVIRQRRIADHRL